MIFLRGYSDPAFDSRPAHLFSVCREQYRKIGFLVPRSCRQRQLYAWAGFAGVPRTWRHVPFFCSQAQVLASWPVWTRRTVTRQNCEFIRSCSSSQVVDFPFVPQRQIPTVLPVWKTVETPQMQYVAWWSIPLLCRSVLDMPVVVQRQPGWPRQYRKLSGSTAGAVPAWLWTSLRFCGDVREVPQILAWTRPSSSEEGRFFAAFCGSFFALRPRGRECPFFQPSVAKSFSSSMARGGGDAGRLPGVLPNKLSACIGVLWLNTIITLPHPHYHHHHQAQPGCVALLCVAFLCRVEAADLYGGWRRGDLRCKAEETAALALVVATRVSERPHGTERSRPQRGWREELRATGTDVVQCRAAGAC